MSLDPAQSQPRVADGMAALQWRVEQFLYHEAQLLDERRYEEWLDLLDPSVTYLMPMRVDRLHRHTKRYGGPADEVMVFDDDFASLKGRVARIRSGVCWAEDPPARVRHMISNVQIAFVSDDLHVRSSFMVYVSRMEEAGIIFSGQRNDKLTIVGDGFQVKERSILGDQTVMLSNNLTIFF